MTGGCAQSKGLHLSKQGETTSKREAWFYRYLGISRLICADRVRRKHMLQILRSAVAPARHEIRRRHRYAALFVFTAIMVAGVSAVAYRSLPGTPATIPTIAEIAPTYTPPFPHPPTRS